MGMTINKRTCCFTGHRIIRKADAADIVKRIEDEICACISRGIETFISGGALGFDMLAAETVLAYRKKNGCDIKLKLMLPCRDQADKWSVRDRARYEKILSCADDIIYISEDYTPECMQRRNRAMVDASEHCIAYMYKTFGGTAYTVKYANSCDIGLTLI